MHGEPWKLKQDDGTMVDVLIWGDEYYQHVESLDGYTLMRDPVTSAIVYARLSDDGAELVSTGVKVGSVHPSTLGLQPHITISRESHYNKQKEMREMAGVPMPGEMTVRALPPPSTGNVLGLVLIVDFDDQTSSIPRDDIDDFCNMDGYTGYGNNGSVQDYFEQVSDGLLNYTSYVLPTYYRADSLFSYYDDCAVAWLSRAKQLIKEVLDDMEANGHDFSVYDSNGDGYIDALNLFYAGNTGCGWALGMWPGSGGMKDEWSADGVATDRFQITGIGGSLSQGTYLHENGHMVGGWPDLYDYSPPGPDDSRGVGRWCLMASQFGSNTQEPNGYFKITAGWATPTVINADQLGINLGPSSDNSNIFKFPNPGNAKEFFIVENRRQTGRDALLPDSGMEILHIDEDGNNTNQEMTPASHYLVTVVQADGLWDLENDVNSGDADDLFRAPQYTACTPCFNPDTDGWDGTPSGYFFTTTSPSADWMTFDFTTSDEAPTASVKSYGADGDTDCCILVGVSDIDDGSSDPNGAGDIESLLITKVDGNPVTPASTVEVCGEGLHTVTLTITDKCGNTDSAVASVEVENEAPVALCKNFAAEADEDCCIIVNLADIDNGSYDPDGMSDLEYFGISHVDGNMVGANVVNSVEVCGNGMHTVTISMRDWCGQVASCDANVEVIDVTPPEITVALDRDALWPPNHKLVDILATVEVTDNCDPDPDWYLESITSNEPDDGRGDGNTTGDIQAAIGTEDLDFQLRAERMGMGDGRKYTVIYYAEDESGNVARDTACVEVPHDQGHPSMMAADGFISDGTGFTPSAETFTVVIASTADLDAMQVDPYRTYVGNSAVAIQPVSSRIVDANDDGLNDLAVLYSIEQAEDIPTGHWLSRIDGLAEAAEYGYLGLHFWAPDGSGRLVTDVLSLGEPITLGDGADRKFDPKLDIVMTPEVPKAFEDGISSIYPNPFNPATTIKFSLAEARGVKVAIYNVDGALVRVLVDQSMGAGEHTVGWNGTDSQGRSVASGVYFARMVSGDFAMTRKMVLMK
jgi:M6 family metalloprotease-like protein